MRQRRVRISAALVVAGIVAGSGWLWATGGGESTDDAQVDGHLAQVAARVGGTVQRVAVTENQLVEAGAILIEIDPQDYQVARERAAAELADAEAAAEAARTNVPITSTTAESAVQTALGTVEQTRSGIGAAEKEIDAARARLTTSQARQREADVTAANAVRDVERFRMLLAKDEVSQQQFDATAARAEAARAAADSSQSQATEAEHGIAIAESRLRVARAEELRAQAQLTATSTAPQQVVAVKARAQSADARVEQARAALRQADLNLHYVTVRAPMTGIVSRKSVELGQVIQSGQSLMTIVPLDDVWITANFKETQLTNIRAGQPATIAVDAYGKTFTGHVDSIAAATGARFSLLPPENATGNYVKVVQRVPVKLVLESGQDLQHLLRPGLSVTASVHPR
jgi:membrane fusion protein (multidrug efflux system)